jgi:hypothetical protein
MPTSKGMFAVRSAMAVIVLATAGCHRPQPSLPRGFEIPTEETGIAISRAVYLVADNQIHNLYGEPVPIFRTGWAYQLVKTAVRPVQLDLYGPDLLQWVAERRGAQTAIIHVGDAADGSCTGELLQFFEIMRHGAHGWAMAPGNHDGFFYGNEDLLLATRSWEAACRNGGRPLTKDLFVRYYLAALYDQDDRYDVLDRAATAHADPARLRATHDIESIAALVRSSGPWEYDPASGGQPPLVRAIEWKIVPDARWQSFVVQRVDLTLPPQVSPDGTQVDAVLLDTAQYAFRPTILPSQNAGLHGDIGDDQSAIVSGWMSRGRGEKHAWVLFGHHPYDALTDGGRANLDQLRQRGRVPVYVSAHTHAGQFITHRTGQDTWLELNLGSILDWSIDFRDFTLLRTKDGRLGIRSPRFTMDQVLLDAEQVPGDSSWEPKPDEPDHLVTYDQLGYAGALETELRLKNVLLASQDRLVRTIHTRDGADTKGAFWPRSCPRPCSDTRVRSLIAAASRSARLQPKIDLLLQLAQFDRNRPVADPTARRRFRLSQAIWASKYDSVQARKPLRDDWFVVFPKE